MLKVNSKLATRQIAFVGSTMDYKKYLTSAVANRRIRRYHVKELEQSFIKFGTAAATIIVVKTSCINGKTEYFIADGQHRVLAASALNLPLNVVIVELVNDTKLNLVKYVAELNSVCTKWGNITYMEKYAECDQNHFALISEVKRTSGLTITDLCNIFGGSESELKAFKQGQINIADIDDSMVLLEAVKMVKHLLPNKAYSRRSVIAIFRMAKDYHKMAKAIIKAVNSGFVFTENQTMLLNELKAIYQTIKK